MPRLFSVLPSLYKSCVARKISAEFWSALIASSIRLLFSRFPLGGLVAYAVALGAPTRVGKLIVASVGIGVISDKRTREGGNGAVPPVAGGARAVSVIQWLSPASRRNVSIAG